MRNSLTAVIAAATVAVSLAAATTHSSAQWRRGWGPTFAGVAGGAVVAGTLGAPYSQVYAYSAAPVYYGYSAVPVFYDYYAPGPGFYSYYAAPGPCWRWRHGYRYRVC